MGEHKAVTATPVQLLEVPAQVKDEPLCQILDDIEPGTSNSEIARLLLPYIIASPLSSADSLAINEFMATTGTFSQFSIKHPLIARHIGALYANQPMTTAKVIEAIQEATGEGDEMLAYRAHTYTSVITACKTGKATLSTESTKKLCSSLGMTGNEKSLVTALAKRECYAETDKLKKAIGELQWETTPKSLLRRMVLEEGMRSKEEILANSSITPDSLDLVLHRPQLTGFSDETREMLIDGLGFRDTIYGNIFQELCSHRVPKKPFAQILQDTCLHNETHPDKRISATDFLNSLLETWQVSPEQFVHYAKEQALKNSGKAINLSVRIFYNREDYNREDKNERMAVSTVNHFLDAFIPENDRPKAEKMLWKLQANKTQADIEKMSEAFGQGKATWGDVVKVLSETSGMPDTRIAEIIGVNHNKVTLWKKGIDRPRLKGAKAFVELTYPKENLITGATSNSPSQDTLISQITGLSVDKSIDELIESSQTDTFPAAKLMRHIRDNAGLKNPELAKWLGVSVSIVDSMLSGRRAVSEKEAKVFVIIAEQVEKRKDGTLEQSTKNKIVNVITNMLSPTELMHEKLKEKLPSNDEGVVLAREILLHTLKRRQHTQGDLSHRTGIDETSLNRFLNNVTSKLRPEMTRLQTIDSAVECAKYLGFKKNRRNGAILTDDGLDFVFLATGEGKRKTPKILLAEAEEEGIQPNTIRLLVKHSLMPPSQFAIKLSELSNMQFTEAMVIGWIVSGKLPRSDIVPHFAKLVGLEGEEGRVSSCLVTRSKRADYASAAINRPSGESIQLR